MESSASTASAGPTEPSQRWIRAALAVALLTTGTLHAQEVNFNSCYARWTDGELVVGNDRIERRWSIEGQSLRPTSFYDRDSKVEWLSQAAATRAHAVRSPGRLKVAAHGGTFSPVEAPSLEVDLNSADGSTLRYRLQLFAEARGVEVDVQPAQAEAAPQPDGAVPTFSIQEQEAAKAAEQKDALLDELPLAPEHLRLTQVNMSTATDIHNQLVSTREWMFMNNEEDIVLRGDLFIAEDVVTKSGLIFLKQAPLPEARAVQTDSDLRVVANTRLFRFMGDNYPSIVLAYNGGRDGRIQALQTYQRQLRQYVPERDGKLLTNTWGDRHRDARINAEFMTREIAAGARLGVDVVQIDDGWQQGRTINSSRGPGVFNGFWATSPPFWDVDPQRFPNGLAPLVAECRRDGLKLGLWYAPDSSNEVANWQRDADKVLDFYRNDSIAYFKFDSINLTSAKAERNLGRLFDRILEGSKGAVTIDLDVTGGGRRPGYFGSMRGGPIFVENRYTDFHRYWPHLTLRNLWELSQYVDPMRLRMEFLNTERNGERYAGDPLAPGRYTPDTVFATVMFSNPLGWFETSNLSPAFSGALKPLVDTWRQERAAMYSGTIVPIGEDPDGVVWTGFASVAKEGSQAYLLAFRELSEQSDWTLQVPLAHGSFRSVTTLAGGGTAHLDGDRVAVHIPEKLGYVWVRLN